MRTFAVTALCVVLLPTPSLAAGGVVDSAPVASPRPLPALSTAGVTVSGLSSGGFMAVQFAVAHSSLVQGVGVLAGGPYRCAEGQADRALVNCMAPTDKAPPPSVEKQRALIAEAARAGLIDAADKLAAQRVWLLSGGRDETVARTVVDALAGFYAATVAPAALRYLRPAEAGHAMISVADPAAASCADSSPPFINRCGELDAAGDLLAHLAGPLAPAQSPVASALQAFDQRSFVPGKAIDAGLAETGYVYVPAACRSGGCKVHVAFHGCRQNAATIGRRFVDGSGYNRWAEGNRLVVLYPQTVARSGFAFGSTAWQYNPKACWDWWGYTGADYANRKGLQIRAVRAMIARLAEAGP